MSGASAVIRYGYNLGGGDGRYWDILDVPNGTVPPTPWIENRHENFNVAEYMIEADIKLQGTGVTLHSNDCTDDIDYSNGDYFLFLSAYEFRVSENEISKRLDLSAMDHVRKVEELDLKLEMALDRLGIAPSLDAGWFVTVASD